ncbi:zinc-binding alcohol dehydrogenase family protein [Microvirga sp. BSC39]|uniref:zinc-binding dehydrogenase n=1 Tax=Microvirga sp. BSC39 TaxID=1549810 RepID=UPI00068E996A
MPSMRALRFEAYGPPSALSLQDIPVPSLNPGEVLVKVHATAVNPSDVKIVSGLFSASLPSTPGRDFAGTVIAGDTWIGKEVWGSGAGFGFHRAGAHAEYVIVPADWLSAKPTALSMEQAASIGSAFVAAWFALMTAGALQGGETVLITGASGAVGQAATQIAHWKGAKVVGADIITSQGWPDYFIDAKRQDLVTEVQSWTHGKGVDLALDAVGGSMFEPTLRSLRLGGRQVAITSVGTTRVEFDLADFYHKQLHLVGVDTAKMSGVEIAAILDQLRDGFETGQLRAPPVRTWMLEQAREAYTVVATGSASAKQVLVL